MSQPISGPPFLGSPPRAGLVRNALLVRPPNAGVGWPHILAREATLISAPTGSGKTLAAFLACIDRLVASAWGELADRTECLYLPLKALGNDIQKNLQVPLEKSCNWRAERGRVDTGLFARHCVLAIRSCMSAEPC